MPKSLFAFILLLASGSLVAQSSAIQPNTGAQGQSLPIIISGQNTNYQAGSPTVRLQYTQGSTVISQGSISGFMNLQVHSPNSITGALVIPTNAPNGTYDLFVNAGTSTLSQAAFTIQPSTSNVAQLSINGAQPGTTINGMMISIPGGSFKASATGINNVWLSKGITILEEFTNITVASSSSFTADLNVPTWAPEGMYDINVYENSGAMHVAIAAFEIDNSFSIAERTIFNFSYFPNPAQDYLRVDYAGSDKSSRIEILDLNGRLLQSQLANPGEGSIEFALDGLAKGMYLLRIQQEGKVLSTKKWQKM